MLRMSLRHVRALISFFHFIWARLCKNPTHRGNVLHALAFLAARRRGRDVGPEHVQNGIPLLFH